MAWICFLLLLVLSVGLTYPFLLEDGAVDTLQPTTPFHTGFTNCSSLGCPDDEAQCTADSCSCLDNYNGPGALACLPPRFEICSIASDPGVKNFKGEFFHLPHPCRFSAVVLRHFFPTKVAWTQMCLVGVDGFNERVRGKFFVGGFIARYRISRRSGYPIILSFRGNGVFDTDTGEYKFERRIRVNNDPWTDLNDPSVDTDGVDFGFHFQASKLRLHLEVKYCGVEVYFRPPHPREGRHQTYLPGLVVGVDTVSGRNVWNGYDTTACLSPAPDCPATMASIAADNSLQTTTMAASYLAWLHTPQKNSRILPAMCKRTADTLSRCPSSQRSGSFAECLSLLTHSVFVNCYSDHDLRQVRILSLFKTCVTSFCDADQGLCENTQQAALDLCGHRNLTQLDILDYDCSLLKT